MLHSTHVLLVYFPLYFLCSFMLFLLLLIIVYTNQHLLLCAQPPLQSHLQRVLEGDFEVPRRDICNIIINNNNKY